MGQVWQATDTRLKREVALKLLPDAFADDPDRLARFEREAQLLASLNHRSETSATRGLSCKTKRPGHPFRSRRQSPPALP